MPKYSEGTIYTGLFLFSLVLVAHIVIALYAILKRIDKSDSPQSFFNYSVMLFCILRICHVATANPEAGTNTPYFFNRFAMLLYLTALSITLYTWIAALGIVLASDSGLVSTVRSFLDRLWWVFVIGNGVLYLIVIILMSLYATAPTDTRGLNQWYDAGIYLLVITFFAMGVMFLIQSIRLYLQSEKCSANVQGVLFRAAVCAMVLAVFFALRVCLFLYRPLSGGKFLPDDIFMWFNYFVTELVPLIMSLVVHWFRVTQTPMSIGYGEREPRKSHGGGVGPRGASTSRRTVGGGGDPEAPAPAANGAGSGGAEDSNGSGGDARSGSQSGPRGVANSSSARFQSTDGETEPDYDMPDEIAERRRLMEA